MAVENQPPEKRGPGRPPGVKNGQGREAQERLARAREAAQVRREKPPAWMNDAALNIDPSKPAPATPTETLSKSLDEITPPTPKDRSKGASKRMGTKGPEFAELVGMAVTPLVDLVQGVTAVAADPKTGKAAVPGFDMHASTAPMMLHTPSGGMQIIQNAPVPTIVAATAGELLAYYATDDESEAALSILAANAVMVACVVSMAIMSPERKATLRGIGVKQQIAQAQAHDAAAIAEAKKAGQVAGAAVATAAQTIATQPSNGAASPPS